ncbi:MAG TPA: response regulator [Actinobacteria bacterium]|jgi:AmiR/NasT family two-component response regulator|nr:response regulator [Actinomycetota bacterium]
MNEPVRVVIAEDESLIRIDLAEMLSELGYDVVGTASDGATAVRLVSELSPEVAILDVKMPVLDGLTAAEEISALGSTAVVMLTAFSQPELVDRANGAGVMAFLVKPIDPSDLRPAIEVARSRFAEKASLTAELGDLAEKLAARKAIERAKGILQSKYGMDESASFRWLQKAAMDGRMSMDAVAAVVIAESEKAPT